MKCVIVPEEKVINLGKRCLSNMRDFVNDKYLLQYNEVKRLRTLYFMACQKVVGEQLKSKENPSSVLEKLNLENINEVWNEKLQEKFWEALMITKESKIVNDDSKVEEIFNTAVMEKYSTKKFSLKETERIFDLIDEGINKCLELNGDLYCDIKDFKKIYHVYNIGYKSLDRV